MIAVPTARRQAAERGDAVERELRTLLLHGVLHCLGYDHETDDGDDGAARAPAAAALAGTGGRAAGADRGARR